MGRLEMGPWADLHEKTLSTSWMQGAGVSGVGYILEA
jgi:hypothetical protein